MSAVDADSGGYPNPPTGLRLVAAFDIETCWCFATPFVLKWLDLIAGCSLSASVERPIYVAGSRENGAVLSLVDHFLQRRQFHERHACDVAAPPDVILEAVAQYRPEADPVFKFAMSLREAPKRFLKTAGDPQPPFGFHSFSHLGRDERSTVYGLIGRFWTPDFDLRVITSGEAFRSFDEAGVAKLVLAFEVDPAPEGLTRLTTETRVFCPDRTSRMSFTPYWMIIRPVSGLIRRRMLASIRRDCERRSGS